MSTDHQSDLSESAESEPLVPWEATGLAEPSEVEDDAVQARRSAVAEKWTRRNHPTAMLGKLGGFLRILSSLLFAHVLFEQRNIDNIEEAARKGPVVYVMRTQSLLDYLYFNWAFLQHSLPVARFSNGRKTILFRGFWASIANLLTRRASTKPEDLMQSLVSHGQSVFLFLERPRDSGRDATEYSQRYLFRLIRAQRQSADTIHVVPMLLVWEKRPDPKNPTILDDIFGTAQSPGFFRKVVNFVQAFWQSFLKFGQPVVQVGRGLDLKELLREYPAADSADASEILREKLTEVLDREERVILGPTGEQPGNLWLDVSRRPPMTKVVREIASEKGQSEDEVMRDAKANFEEIAADPNLLMIKVLSSLLSLVWYRIYDGFEVDEAGMNRLREAASESHIVLVPSHKSHVDYLVLSYLFYQYGLTPPLIAAGVNLSFWPMGYIFRKSGAFFLRRTFKGDRLYATVFREYVIRILEEGYPLEFFIEGTRSRTGKLIKPRYGMLDMVIKAYVSGRLKSLKIVPISVGYEKIIEEGAYRQEILGGEKEKESLGGLLKAPRFLTSKYGRLYVEFSEPIDVQEYLDKYEIDRANPSDEELMALNVRLGHRIIYDINEVTTVTPTALAATVLLNNEGRGLDRARFLRQVGFLVHFLGQPGRISRMSRSLEEALTAKNRLDGDATSSPDSSGSLVASGDDDAEGEIGHAIAELMDQSMDLFNRNDQVKVSNMEGEVFYSVPEDARFELSYYRNNIVHHFVPEALLAAAIGRFPEDAIPLEELMEETLFLSRLFKFEWIYEERAAFKNVFLRTLDYFSECRWVVREWEDGGEVVHIAEGPPAELEFFRRLVLTFLEAYAIVIGLVGELNGPVEKSEILNGALKRARADYLGGKILFHESLSKPTYDNALRLLIDWKVLERVGDGGKKEVFALTPEWSGDRVRDMHQRLERFVYKRAASVKTTASLPS